MKLPVLPVIVAAFSMMSMLAAGVASAEEGDAAQVRGVVEMMNRAVTERDLPRLLSSFAEGSVNIDLFPVHRYSAATGEGNDAVKTANLHERWQAVAPILFATTKVYRRTIRAMDVHVDRGMAVAWLDVETETLSTKEGATTKTNRFSEICILRRYDDGWKIVALTNNRRD